jgi:hypothetical protein
MHPDNARPFLSDPALDAIQAPANVIDNRFREILSTAHARERQAVTGGRSLLAAFGGRPWSHTRRQAGQECPASFGLLPRLTV